MIQTPDLRIRRSRLDSTGSRLPFGETKLVSLAREREAVSRNTGLGVRFYALPIWLVLWADSITSFTGLASLCPRFVRELPPSQRDHHRKGRAKRARVFGFRCGRLGCVSGRLCFVISRSGAQPSSPAPIASESIPLSDRPLAAIDCHSRVKI